MQGIPNGRVFPFGFGITYQKGKTNFVMFTVDVPYDECDKIVASIK